MHSCYIPPGHARPDRGFSISLTLFLWQGGWILFRLGFLLFLFKTHLFSLFLFLIQLFLTLFVLIICFWQGIILLEWFLIKQAWSSQGDHQYYSTLAGA